MKIFHAIDPEIQVIHGDVIFGVVICAVEGLVIEAGKMQHRFAHGFAGNRSGVDAHAADHALFFDDSHSFPEFCGLDRCALSARSGAYNHKIIRSHLRNPAPLRRVPPTLQGRPLLCP